MIYFVHPSDPDSLVNHPWQPHVQHLHILVAPLLVFTAGLIWRRHVWAGWKGGRQRRRSGLSLSLTLVPMVISGYLIQTAVEQSWRHAWVIVHLAASGLWLLVTLVHQVMPLVLGRGPAASRRPAAR